MKKNYSASKGLAISVFYTKSNKNEKKFFFISNKIYKFVPSTNKKAVQLYKLCKKKMNSKLEKIQKKFQAVNYNNDNYSVGGGLVAYKFASNRHEDAKRDNGKLTEGQVVQLFKRATGLETDLIKAIINYAVPNMEWHHAGKLPKAYGGGMKKTYFLNSSEIADLATNWNDYFEKYSLSIQAKKSNENLKKEFEKRQLQFLEDYAKKVERILNQPTFFYRTKQEMNGEYGWFDSQYKSYNMPEYFTGWAFEDEAKYHEFLNLKYK
jgi:hypothetical protein